jgi:hypothetical protein
MILVPGPHVLNGALDLIPARINLGASRLSTLVSNFGNLRRICRRVFALYRASVRRRTAPAAALTMMSTTAFRWCTPKTATIATAPAAAASANNRVKAVVGAQSSWLVDQAECQAYGLTGSDPPGRRNEDWSPEILPIRWRSHAGCRFNLSTCQPCVWPDTYLPVVGESARKSEDDRYPPYQDIPASAVPEITDDDETRDRVICGEFRGKRTGARRCCRC